MQIHNLKRKNANTKKIRVGRGGKRGKTSGRGNKGQKARAGRKLRPEMRDTIKKIPKKRGYGKNRANSRNYRNVKPTTLNLSSLGGFFTSEEIINVYNLIEKGLVKKIKGRLPKVKILAKGEIDSKLNFEGLLLSDVAKEKIIKAGGSVK